MPENPLESRDELIIGSILRLIESGADPLLTNATAEIVLPARGYPLSPTLVRGLFVETWTLGGKNVAPASRWIATADRYVKARADKPNRKVAAAATARRAKRVRADVGEVA